MAEIIAEAVVRVLNDRRRTFRLEIPALHLAPGRRIAILGPTGSGKTTAMDILALAGRPTAAGRFELHDDGQPPVDLARLSGDAALARLRARYFGYVLQTSPLFSFLTVRENASLGQRISGRRQPAFVERLLEHLGLAAAADGRVGDLSVGQRQKVAVARALAHRPRFLLCDEPTAALDPETATGLIRAIVRLATTTGACVVMITHDHALPYAHDFDVYRMVPLADGQAGSVLLPETGGQR